MIDYGFEFPPFGVTPDPRMVYRHAQFDEAFEALEQSIAAGRGFMVVTGEVGAGKTTLLRSFLSAEHEKLDTAVVLNTGLDADGLLRAIADDLEVGYAASADRKSIIDALNEKLMSGFAAGRQTAIFIDEAQHLSVAALELLRMLSNLETETDKLMQIVLFGQNELRETLARPDLVQLRSRIAVHRHLKPLTLAETSEYLSHRIAAAKPAVPVGFEPAAVRRLHKASQGLPRVINILADSALHVAEQAGVSIVGASQVVEAERQFAELEPGTLKGRSAGRNVQVALSWALLLLVIVMLGLRFRHRPEAPPPASVTPPPAVETSDAPPAEASVSIVERFLALNGAAVPDTGGVDAIREDRLGRTVGRVWTRIPPDPALIEAVGLPALVQLNQAGIVRQAVVTRSDLPGLARIVRADGAEHRVAYEELAIDPLFPASVLLPTDVPLPYARPGSTGEIVRKLQNALHAAGTFRGVVNGVYGPTTEEAVRVFQRREKLPEDGLAGPWTVGALDRAGLWPTVAAQE